MGDIRSLNNTERGRRGLVTRNGEKRGQPRTKEDLLFNDNSCLAIDSIPSVFWVCTLDFFERLVPAVIPEPLQVFVNNIRGHYRLKQKERHSSW